jgi:transposase-like protein
MGPFHPTNGSNLWILIIVDYLSKWPITVTLPDKKANTITKAFIEQLVCMHGAPKCLLSDQGKEFLNDMLQHVNNDLAIHKLNTSTHRWTG